MLVYNYTVNGNARILYLHILWNIDKLNVSFNCIKYTNKNWLLFNIICVFYINFMCCFFFSRLSYCTYIYIINDSTTSYKLILMFLMFIIIYYICTYYIYIQLKLVLVKMLSSIIHSSRHSYSVNGQFSEVRQVE